MPSCPLLRKSHNESTNFQAGSFTFDGSDCGFPAELFVDLIENSCQGQDSEYLLSFAKDKLSENVLTMLKESDADQSWQQMRQFLMDQFGKKCAFGIIDCLHLLSSLVRQPNETSIQHLLRVKFCVEKIETLSGTSDYVWLKLLYLQGLTLPLSAIETQLSELLREVDENLASLQDVSFTEKTFFDQPASYQTTKSEDAQRIDVKVEAETFEDQGDPLDTNNVQNNDEPEDEEYKLKSEASIVEDWLVDMEADNGDDGEVDEEADNGDDEGVDEGADNGDDDDYEPPIKAKKKKKSSSANKIEADANQPPKKKKKKKKVARKDRKLGIVPHQNRIYWTSMNDVKWENPMVQQLIINIKEKNNTIYICAICVKQGKRESIRGRIAFLKHTNDLHNGHSMICDSCDFSAAGNCMDRLISHRFMVHKKEFEGYEVTQCPIEGCNKRFITNADKKSHQLVYHERSKLKGMCPVCGKLFANKYQIQKHIEKMHEGKAETFKCDQCDKEFKNRDYMKRHQVIAHGEGPKVFQVVCDICGKLCRDKYAMRRHIKEDHNKERKHACPDCGKRFFDVTVMKRHLGSVHKKGKYFVCQHCGLHTGTYFNLKTHIDATHLNKKHYHCKACDTWYTASHTLAVHIATRHLGLSITNGKKSEVLAVARQNEAFEKVKDEDAKIGKSAGRSKLTELTETSDNEI